MELHYKNCFGGIEYDFKIPNKIYIVSSKTGKWNFIKEQLIELFLESPFPYPIQNKGKVIYFTYYEADIEYNSFFYPHEILNKEFEFLSEERFKQVKAFI